MRILLFRVATAVVLVAGLTAPSPAGVCGAGDSNEDHDLAIGQNGSALHKIVLVDEDGFCHLTGQPIVLEPGDGLNDGYYVHQFPGWDATRGEPFPLPVGHRLTLNRISSSNAAFDMLDPGLGMSILATDGSSFEFPWGGDLEHEDVFYRMDSAFANVGDTFSTIFRLTDASGQTSPSDEFTLNFEIAPEPSAACLLMLGALAVLRRRSRAATC